MSIAVQRKNFVTECPKFYVKIGNWLNAVRKGSLYGYKYLKGPTELCQSCTND